jgi:hypothetical protein
MAPNKYEIERKRQAELRAIEKEEARVFYENSDPAVIRQMYFKDYGCINFKSDEFYKALRFARDLHDIDEARHPELHDKRSTEPYRCYHKVECKCGYSEACDSSD